MKKWYKNYLDEQKKTRKENTEKKKSGHSFDTQKFNTPQRAIRNPVLESKLQRSKTDSH